MQISDFLSPLLGLGEPHYNSQSNFYSQLMCLKMKNLHMQPLEEQPIIPKKEQIAVPFIQPDGVMMHADKEKFEDSDEE